MNFYKHPIKKTKRHLQKPKFKRASDFSSKIINTKTQQIKYLQAFGNLFIHFIIRKKTKMKCSKTENNDNEQNEQYKEIAKMQ